MQQKHIYNIKYLMSDCFHTEVCSKTDKHEGNACPLSRLPLHRVDDEFGDIKRKAK